MIVAIVAFVVILGLLVFVHELGHFVTARAFGIRVHEFGFGYPPRIVGIRRGETIYSLNWIPLGGFVKLAGEEDPQIERSFASKPAWQRLVVLLAGAGMNAVLPVVLFTAVFMVPQDVTRGDVVVLEVQPNSPAANAGLRPGDQIVSAFGRDLDNHTDLARAINLRLGADLKVQKADGSTTTMLPRWRPPAGQGAAGVSITTALVSLQEVPAGSAAFQAGLRPGDRLLTVAGVPVFRSDQLAPGWLGQAVDGWKQGNTGDVPVRVWREGQVVPLSVTPDALPSFFQGATAVTAPPAHEGHAPWSALYLGARQTVDALVLFKNEATMWIIGTRTPQVMGPVGIAQVAGETAQFGFLPLIDLAALLSLNLAILNILPIPMLDGGRMVFVAIEWVRRGKRVPPEKEGLVHMIGFAVMIAMALIVTYYDVLRIVSGEKLIG